MPTLEWIGKEKALTYHQKVMFCVFERKYSCDKNNQHDEYNVGSRRPSVNLGLMKANIRH